MRWVAYLTGGVEVAESLAGDFHEDDLVLDAGGEEVVYVSILLFRVSFQTRLNEQQALRLDVFGLRAHCEHRDHLSARLHDEEELVVRLEISHGRPIE